MSNKVRVKTKFVYVLNVKYIKYKKILNILKIFKILISIRINIPKLIYF